MPADHGAPIFTLKLKPAPGSDGVREMRQALKILWRRFQLKCVSVEQQPPGGPDIVPKT